MAREEREGPAMPDETYRDEVNRHSLAVLEQIARILRTDAEIVEILHRMMGTAEEEVRRRPNLLFEAGAPVTAPRAGEGDIVGGQTVAEKVIAIILGHLEREKDLIKPYLGKIIDGIFASF
jgi:hypothetical protein